MPGGVGLFWVGWGKGQGGIEVWHVSKKIIPERLLQTCAHIIYVCTYGTVLDYTYIYTYIIMYSTYAYYAYKKHDVLYARTNTRVVRLVASSDLLIEFLFIRKPVLVGIYILMHPLK